MENSNPFIGISGKMNYHSNPTKRIDSPVAPRSPSPKKMAVNRRRSVADEALMTQNYIQNNIEELTRLWDEVYMSEENRVSRLATAYDHIRELVDNMVAGEKVMVEGVKNNTRSGTESINRMREQLKMDPWQSRHPFPSIALLRAVEKEEMHLKEIYEARQKEQQSVFERIQVLCFRLGRFAVDLLPETKQMLSDEELEKYKGHMREMEADVAERLLKAKTLQLDIQQWYKNLGTSNGPSDDVTLQVIIDNNIDDDDFALTDVVLEKIEEIWNELSGMHQAWLENVDLEWVTRYSQLEELWDKCLVEEEQRQFTPRFDPAHHKESDLEEMTAEIQYLQSQYKSREPVYKVMAEWKTAWKSKLAMEEKKKDASYYQSRGRGCTLMHDIQHERNLNEVQLPKLKKAVAASYATFKKQYADDSISVEGHEPLDYIEWTEKEYQLKKEMERMAKKNLNNTPSSPAKSLKSAPRTPHALRVPAKQPRMTLDQHVSIITPVRTVDGGPKTSSPKESVPSTPRRLLSPTKASRLPRSPMRRRNL